MASRPKSFRKPAWFQYIPMHLPDDPSHPAQIALRTYALALFLSLTPSLLPFATAVLSPKQRSHRTSITYLKKVLRRELGYDGFPFSITVAIGGGAFIQHIWSILDDSAEWPWDQYNTRRDDTADRGQILRALVRLRTRVASLSLTPTQKSLLANLFSSALGLMLFQVNRKRVHRISTTDPAVSMPLTLPIKGAHTRTEASPTLDLTLLLLVRAVDAVVQSFVFKRSEPMSRDLHSRVKGRERELEADLLRETLRREKEKQESSIKRQRLTTRIDALVFWACSARIMWCYFYQPYRLPKSYVKWISTIASVDSRLLKALRSLRSGDWSYINGSPTQSHLLTTLAQDLGYPASWGDPSVLPAYGGPSTDAVWRSIGVQSRKGLGGIPCELVHGSVGSRFGLSDSCTMNAGIRGAQAFLEAIAIYLPVHFLPLILTRPRAIMGPGHAMTTLLGALRSATFLSTFVVSYWYSVCLTRTLMVARLFPFISHDIWDGPYGCIMAGCLACGSSIWIENGRRRGEMALYVLPRAIRACLPDTWVKAGNRGYRITERIAFVVSLAWLLTAAIHKPGSLRGLSRWTLAFIMKGPNAGFWKRKRRSPSVPITPSAPDTPVNREVN